MNIGIVGVGLLGGSLAAVLKQQFGENISIAAFSSPRTLEKAKATGIYSEYYTYDQLTTDTSLLDFIFLCTPIKIIAEHIKALGKAVPFKKQVVVTDIGSTKSYLMNVAEEAFAGRDDIVFIGGHPMTGNEFNGIDAADPLLYENAIYVITPSEKVSNEQLHTYIELIKAIGAIPLILEAKKHDQIVARISHLPQMLATGLVDLVSKGENPELSKQLSAGGFRDMTRIASSQFKMWEDIVETNKENIESVIDSYIDQLQLIKSTMREGGLDKIFENARDTREGIPTGFKGMLVAHYELLVRVHDEPGALLKISTILAENDINIKDISVQKNRELEGGHFLLGFESENQRKEAEKLLQDVGYKTKRVE